MISKLGTKPTSTAQLDRIGSKEFKDEWGHVWPLNVKTSQLPKSKPLYFIINTTQKPPGVHWVACYISRGTVYIWDSFARPSKKLIPTFLKNMKHKYTHRDTQLDGKTNQLADSDICGPLCLAFLKYVKQHGITKAMKL